MRGLLDQELRGLIADYGLSAVVEVLVDRCGPDLVQQALTAVLPPRRRGRPVKTETRNAKIARFLLERQRNGEKASITEAVRAIMPQGTPKDTIKRLVKEFDGFSWDDPKRGWDRGKWYPGDDDK